MAKKEKRSKTDQAPIPKVIEAKDFGKFKPKRMEPGPIGRTKWFVERAGNLSNSLSLSRLKEALNATAHMLSEEQQETQTLEELRNTWHGTAGKKSRFDSFLAIDTRGELLDCKAVEQQKSSAGYSAVCQPFRLNKLESRKASIFIRVDAEKKKLLDLEKVVVADISDPKQPRLVNQFHYLEEEGILAGVVNRPGVFQAYAFPKNPWLKIGFWTICHYWKWIVLDLHIQQLAVDKSTAGTLKLTDKICELILCNADFRNFRDIKTLSQMGISLPPGLESGLTEEGWKDFQNVCKRCLRDFLGEIRVIDRVVIPHPLFIWCWWPRRCSKWVSVGPYPGENFRGIGRVTQLDVNPLNGDHLIAGACGGGVWRTVNGGQSWTPLMDQEPTLTIGAVAMAPSNTNFIYAASGEDGGGYNPAWGGVGLYRSIDNGAHWQLMSPVPSTRFSAIVVHPSNPDTIYVCGNAGLHKSIDGGTTWIANPGLSSLYDGQVTDVVLAHDDPDRVYIGVRNVGVFRSTTGGEQIGPIPGFQRMDGPAQLPSGSDAGWIKLAIGRNGVDGSSFLVTKMGSNGSRIFSTLDGGNFWRELAGNVASVSYDEWCSVIAVDPQDQDILYAGGATTLMRTTNGGYNIGDWVSIYNGVHADQQDIAFHPANPSIVYLANDGGIYRTANQGNTWEFRSGNLRITQLYDIDICEKDRDVIAGGAQDNGVYFRNTAGVWRHIPWGDGTQVAVDPTNPDIFYFSSQNGLPNWLRRSTDGGLSHQALGASGLTGGSPWITIIKVDPTDPIVDPLNGRTLFVCGHNWLFRSTDSGQNWQRVEDGAGAAFTTDGTITALEFAPGNPDILYMGTSSGALYRATGGGIHTADWTRIDTVGSDADALFPNVQIQSLRINPHNPNDVWVVFGGAGVTYTARPDMILNPLGISHLFRTTDGGANWMDASGAFPALNLPDVPTSAVAIHDNNSEVAFAGTDVGVFKTTDGGITWNGFQDGLPRCPVVELRFNRRFNRLFAGTMGRGAYFRDV